MHAARTGRPDTRASRRGRARAAGPRKRRGGRRWIALAVVAFAVTRLYLLGPFEPMLSTLGLYARYAYEWTLARHERANVYDLHERLAEQAAARAGVAPTREQRTIEYPPLALLAIAAPMSVGGSALPAGPPPAVRAALDERVLAYPEAWRRMCALIDAACFALLAFALRRRSGGETALRLGFYTLATLLLAHLLYERLDVIAGTLLAAALVALVSARRWVGPAAALAVAVAFKLAPVVVAPLWALGSLRADLVRAAPWPGLVRRVALRTLAFAALVLLAFAATWAAWGPRTLDFLGYHEARGIQIESLSASILLVTRAFGVPVRIEQAYGAWNLASPLSGALSAVSPVLVALAVAGVLAASLAWSRRHATNVPEPLSMTAPDRFAGMAALTLLVAMAFSKVLSPQYLLWVAPLLALAPARGRTGWIAAVVALAVFALTTAIYPYNYFEHVLGVPPGRPLRGAEPSGTTTFGAALLLARNLGLLLLCALLARLCFEAPASSGAPSAGGKAAPPRVPDPV